MPLWKAGGREALLCPTLEAQVPGCRDQGLSLCMGLLTRWPCEFATDGHTPAAVPDSTKSLSVPREQSLRMASVFDLEELVDGVRSGLVGTVKELELLGRCSQFPKV